MSSVLNPSIIQRGFIQAFQKNQVMSPQSLCYKNPLRSDPQQLYKHTVTKSDRGAHAVIGKNIRRANEKTLLNADGSYMYGLKPVDFTTPPRIYVSPPPPPKKPGVKNYIFPATLIVTVVTFMYFYLNNKNDAYGYWSAMQTGGIMPMFGKEDVDEDK